MTSDLKMILALIEQDFECGKLRDCGQLLPEIAYYGCEDFYCEKCMRGNSSAGGPAMLKRMLSRIAGSPDRYPDTNPSASSAAPVKSTSRDSRNPLPNAYQCYLRHHCTNYDELIRPLERTSLADQFLYAAIRNRIEQLLEEELWSMEMNELEESEESEVLA